MLRNCSKDTLFGRADDRLSRFASQLVQLTKANKERHDDVDAWHTPSECHGLVEDQFFRELDTLCKEFGVADASELYVTFHERVTEKWLYDYGFLL